MTILKVRTLEKRSLSVQKVSAGCLGRVLMPIVSVLMMSVHNLVSGVCLEGVRSARRMFEHFGALFSVSAKVRTIRKLQF